MNRIGITTYEYDAQGRISTVSFTHDGKLEAKEMYTYTAAGLPETVKIVNDKG